MRGKKYEPVEIDGVVYINPAHASDLLGISRNTMYKLLKTRPELSFEDAVRLYLNKDKARLDRSNVVIYNGVKYSSVFEACVNLGMCYSTIYYRMREHNISFEEAVNFDRADYIKSNSEDGFNLAKYCKDKNLDYKKMYRYVNTLGLSVEEAEDRVLHNRLEVEYKGNTYRSLYDACIMLKIPYAKTYNRIKRGISIEEAIDMGLEENKGK